MAEHAESSHDRSDEAHEVHQRLLLPLLIPAGVFLFSALVIYGLSRIYLDLRSFEVGEVNMATPLALFVALAILGTAWYLATHPEVPRWQIASIVAAAVVLLTGGAIWAAVHEEELPEKPPAVVGPGDATPPADSEPGGGIAVGLIEFEISLGQESAPAGPVSFAVTNEGSTDHNLRVILTDLAPDQLPTANNQVDESAVDVIAQTSADLDPGASEQVQADLQPGNYVLICNIVGHYDLGMRAAFTVQ